jgi:ribosome biogenesis GTPase A
MNDPYLNVVMKLEELANRNPSRDIFVLNKAMLVSALKKEYIDTWKRHRTKTVNWYFENRKSGLILVKIEPRKYYLMRMNQDPYDLRLSPFSE